MTPLIKTTRPIFSGLTHRELIITVNPYNLIIIVSLGDRAAIAKFHGVQRKETSIIVAEDFVFDKYVILHEMGHVFGCSHEIDPKHPYHSPLSGNPGK